MLGQLTWITEVRACCRPLPSLPCQSNCRFVGRGDPSDLEMTRRGYTAQAPTANASVTTDPGINYGDHDKISDMWSSSTDSE